MRVFPRRCTLRLLSALHKPTTGRLSRLLHGSEVDAGQRAALLATVAEPRRQALRVLDDRLVAGAIGPISAEPGVSIAFAALIAHAHSTGQPILIDPGNEGRWQEAAAARHIDVIVRRATTG